MSNRTNRKKRRWAASAEAKRLCTQEWLDVVISVKVARYKALGYSPATIRAILSEQAIAAGRQCGKNWP